MKFFSVLIAGFLLSSIVFSQEFEGKISYTEVVDLSEFQERMREHNPMLPADLPSERNAYQALYVKGTESLYTKDEEASADETVSDDRRQRMIIRMAGRDEKKVYRNTSDNSYIEERVFFDKQFLVMGPPKAYQWKITGEQMQVGSYLCMKAISKDSNETIVAWFTPQIAIPLGPEHYAGLPGLVLHVDINDGQRTITAQDFKLGELPSGLIRRPEKGKEVTREEFDEIVMEKTEETRGSGGPPGTIFIHRHGNE